jgi:hypothetical protein
MQPELQAVRPPYIMFETRAVEDRTASIEQGHYVARDVDYVLVTPPGSKDQIDRVATEWLDHQDKQARDGRVPREWAKLYREAYNDWKAGKEIPLHGTPIVAWPPIQPSQRETLIRIKVLTVEDLAQANEEIIGRLGMGGRALKQLAITWLASSSDSGKVATKAAATSEENERLRAENETLKEKIAELEVQLPKPPSPSERAEAAKDAGNAVKL